MCTNFKSTPQRHVKSPTFWNFLDFVKNLTHQDFFSKFKISCEKKLLLVASMGYLSIKIFTKRFFQNSKIFTSKKNPDSSYFDEVRKISKFGWFDMPLGSTFEIGTQIILSKIDGFLKGWILNITPLKVFYLKVFILPRKLTKWEWRPQTPQSFI